MRYLIDTHVCLWAVSEPHKLSGVVKGILQDPDNEIAYSHISLLEIAIKYQTGKLSSFNISLTDFNSTLQEKGFTPLSLTLNHVNAYFQCSFFSELHRDPFDRSLVAIAHFEKIAFITQDDKFGLYKNEVDIVW